MKTIKSSEPFMLSNRGKIFLFLIISIALFFAFAIIADGQNANSPEKKNLPSKDLRDPLGYDIIFGDNSKAYLIYHLKADHLSFGFESRENIILVDSFYVVSPKKTLLYDYPEEVVSRAYHCSDGKEIFLYTKTDIVRSQENWPAREKVIKSIYGKKEGNAVYLREDLKREPFKKGLFAPILSFTVILALFIALTLEKYSDMSRKFSLEPPFSYYSSLLLLLFSLLFLSISLLNQDKYGFMVYSVFILSGGVIQFIIDAIYAFSLKRYRRLKEEQNKK